MQAHPAADLFPLLEGDAYESLKTDIGERGLLEPIWLCEGQILDGRNRFRACVDTGTEPRFRNYEGESPVAFVWSLNGVRRQLSKSQLSLIAVKMLPALKEEAKKRQRLSQGRGFKGTPKPEDLNDDDGRGEAVVQAAQLVGVGKTAVYDAKTVVEQAPELVAEIQSGSLSVDKAAKLVRAKTKKNKSETPPSKPQRLSRDERVEQIEALAKEGYRGDQIAEQIGLKTVSRVREIAREHNIALPEFRAGQGRTARIKIDRVIQETVNSLMGLSTGLSLVKDSMSSIEPEQAAEWASAISEPLKSLNWLNRKLTEIANGN